MSAFLSLAGFTNDARIIVSLPSLLFIYPFSMFPFLTLPKSGCDDSHKTRITSPFCIYPNELCTYALIWATLVQMKEIHQKVVNTRVSYLINTIWLKYLSMILYMPVRTCWH